jgi:hypothetical protein
MSRPGAQRRALDQIERALLEDDRRLGPLFATFTRLVSPEAMPWAERVITRPWLSRPRVRAAAMVIGLAAVTSAVLFALLAPRPQTCPGPAAPSLARAQPVHAGQRASCLARPAARITRAAPGPPGS